MIETTRRRRELQASLGEIPRLGMTRREMLRNAALAGAAAWTAPVILDSVSSAALGATGSACIKYFVKIAKFGDDPQHCPGSGSGRLVTQDSGSPAANTALSFPVGGDRWGGAGTPPSDGCTLSVGSNVGATITDGGATYWQINLPAGFRFTTLLDWNIGGRYGTSDPGDRYIKVTDRTSASGFGYFTNNGQTAFLVKDHPDGGGRVLQYAYVQFCGA